LHACWPTIRTGVLPFGGHWLAESHGGGGITSGMNGCGGRTASVHGMGTGNWGQRRCLRPYGGVCVLFVNKFIIWSIDWLTDVTDGVACRSAEYRVAPVECQWRHADDLVWSGTWAESDDQWRTDSNVRHQQRGSVRAADSPQYCSRRVC